MTTAIAKRESASKFEMIIDGSAERLKAAMPEHFTPAKLAQVLSIIAFKTPKLSQCVPESIITSIITAGSLGLDLTPALGECYLIPRFNKDLVVNGAKGALECQCQPGYHGLKKLAMQTGEIAYIDPRVVRKGEVFRVAYDPELTFFHEPKFDDKAPITHVYCVTKLTNGERKIEVMTTEQIEKIRARSKSEGFSPWDSDWPEMAKKTVFKRQSKYLPRSLKLAEAIELDNREYEIDQLQIEDDRTEHHAKNFNNNTGYRDGSTADQATRSAYRKWLAAFVAEKNKKWHERMSAKGEEIYQHALAWNNGQLLSTIQTSGHILKWARENELINASAHSKNGQYDPFSAVVWDREQERTEQEATEYAALEYIKAKSWAIARRDKARKDALMPGVPRPTPLEPEDESQETDADDVLDATFGDATDDTFEEGRE